MFLLYIQADSVVMVAIWFQYNFFVVLAKTMNYGPSNTDLGKRKLLYYSQVCHKVVVWFWKVIFSSLEALLNEIIQLDYFYDTIQNPEFHTYI